jgi:hypothetical protein
MLPATVGTEGAVRAVGPARRTVPTSPRPG